MGSEIYIYHKLGLGDHIICNGLVRQYALNYKKVYVLCKKKNLKQVDRMYMDNPNIVPIEARPSTLKLGNNYLVLRPNRFEGDSFDRQMYTLAGVDFNHKWESFYVQRNRTKENELAEYFDGIGDFVFVHDDKVRDYVIKDDLVDKRIIRPSIRFGVFDYLKILENASEVHCIDSSFLNLIECSGIKTGDLFFHKYVRIKENTHWGTPVLKNDWRILK